MFGIPTIPSVYVWLGLFLAGCSAGGYASHVWHKAARADALERAGKAERALQRGANQADVRYVDALHAQLEHAQANADAFKRTLDEKNRELASCRVDASVVGLLDDAGRMPGPASDPAQPGPASPGAEAAPHAGGNAAGGIGGRGRDSTAAAELGTCRANYAEVCVPNAVHLRELQLFTRKLIGDYNKAVGKD